MNINGITPKALTQHIGAVGVRTGIHRFVNIGKQLNLYYFWEKRWFFIAMAVGVVLLNLETPGGLSREGLIVLTMSVVATILFVTEPVPLPTVALIIVAGLVVGTGVNTSGKKPDD